MIQIWKMWIVKLVLSYMLLFYNEYTAKINPAASTNLSSSPFYNKNSAVINPLLIAPVPNILPDNNG